MAGGFYFVCVRCLHVRGSDALRVFYQNVTCSAGRKRCKQSASCVRSPVVDGGEEGERQEGQDIEWSWE